MIINKSTIQAEIIAGKTMKAIEMLLKIGEKYDSDLYNSSIMLSGRYNSLKKDKMHGIVAGDSANIAENRINFALTQILTEVKANWEIGGTSSPETQTPTNKNILFLAANPRDTRPLRLGEELREIKEGLRRGRDGNDFNLIQIEAVRIPDLRRALLDQKPSIIHFSGHGESSGRIILEDESGNSQEIPPKALGDLFSLFSDSIKCVVLNACYSEAQAQEIAQHIPYVIGMNDAILDKAAIAFSSAFYDAIANGRDLDFAFNFAKISIGMYDIKGDNIPVLLKKQVR